MFKKSIITFLIVVISLIIIRIFYGYPRRFRPFEYSLYLKTTIQTGSPAVDKNTKAESIAFIKIKKERFSSGIGSIDKFIGKRIDWQGGLYYPLLNISQLRKATPARINFLVNIGLTTKAFGEGLVLVAFDGDLPKNLYYEDNLRITGIIRGVWNDLVVVYAEKVEKI